MRFKRTLLGSALALNQILCKLQNANQILCKVKNAQRGVNLALACVFLCAYMCECVFEIMLPPATPNGEEVREGEGGEGGGEKRQEGR